MLYKWTDGRDTSTPPTNPDNIREVKLSAAEWFGLQNLIEQLRRPWVRNANKDRGIRPARSESGYVLLAAKPIKISGKNAYRITVETPYRLDAFEPEVAQKLVEKDADNLAKELGYKEYRSPYTSYTSCLCNAQIDIDFTRNEYYHAVFEAATLPNVVIQK